MDPETITFYTRFPNSDILIQFNKTIHKIYKNQPDILFEYRLYAKKVNDYENSWNDTKIEDSSIYLTLYKPKLEVETETYLLDESFFIVQRFMLCLVLSDMIVNNIIEIEDTIKFYPRIDMEDDEKKEIYELLNSFDISKKVSGSKKDKVEYKTGDLSNVSKLCNETWSLNITPENIIVNEIINMKELPVKFTHKKIIINTDGKFNIKDKNIEQRIYVDSKNKYEDIKLFLDEQSKYINNLSLNDKITIYGYTRDGDKGLNYYLTSRNFNFFRFKNIMFLEYNPEQNPNLQYNYNKWQSQIFPYYSQIVKILKLNKKDSNYKNLHENILFNIPKDQWIRILQLYVDDLKRIINGSPKLKSNIIVYRGVKDSFHNRPEKKYKDQKYIEDLKLFSSTTLNIDTAISFTNDEYKEKCCILRYILLKGSHVLFASVLSAYSNNEFEILLNVGSDTIIGKSYKTNFYDVKKPKSNKKDIYNVTDIINLIN